VKAYQCLANYEPKTLKALFEVFNQTAIEVCEGQQMDMDFELRSDVTEAEYIEMIRLKTSVLLGCALQMGAIVGGANEQAAGHLYQFGVQLGLAFQIQDDLLDLYGESAAVGKQIGGDVLANKKTLLSIAAKHLANEQQKIELDKLTEIQDPELKVKFAQDLYSQIGAEDYCKNQMENFHASALHALNELPSITSKNPFLALAEFLLHRNH
jgi:geranylgeranyl diphosphate synthase type II